MSTNMIGFLPQMMIALIFLEIFFNTAISQNERFNLNYEEDWGSNHFLYLKDGQEVQLSLEKFSGAGFRSKAYYGSGFFQMKIKPPPKDSTDVVTAFYLNTDVGVHYEFDFEFMGDTLSRNILLQTNVYINGLGGREQRTYLWFDPTTDFHYYKILWNQHQIVFYVDNTPIRVYKNDNITRVIGYPHQAMRVVVSIWNASWASNGEINWSSAPFQAHFQDFHIDGCPSDPNTPNEDCYSTKYRWNKKNYWQISPRQKKKYDNARKRYLHYDYCTDKGRYPVAPPECLDG